MKNILFFLLILCSHIALAQRNVSGYISDKTSKPIESVEVSVKNTDIKTLTDASGKYSLQLPEGTNTLEFSKNNFRVQKVDISSDVVDLTMTSLADVDVFELSLEELMNVKVEAGSLIRLTKSKIPVSLTTITSEEIALTPARNLSDLIEIYVPGALFENHTSPRMGIRGIIIDRNYKFLMLVNGKNLNQKGAQGATLEISNWDLNDIESIEIIRGPGSVTYGPGAIAGVINIITKTATTSKGISGGIDNNITYRSKGAYASGGYMGENFNLYAYGSVRYTDGYKDADYFAINPSTGAFGYLDPSQSQGVIALHGDNFGKPQLKFHLDASFLDEWRFWARYTNSGEGAVFNQKMVLAAGEKVPARFTGQQGIISNLENNHIFNENVSLKSSVRYQYQDFYDYYIQVDTLPYNVNGFNSGHTKGNVVYDFAEAELFLSSIINLNLGDNWGKYALGVEYSNDSYSPRQGKDKMYMFSNNYKAADGQYIEDIVANGFSINRFSVFSECNFEFHPLLNLLLSARMDKTNYSKNFFSPRIGIVSEINKNNTVKLIWQRSLRMNTGEEMYKEHLLNTKGDPETLNCLELMYNWFPINNLLINTSASYNWGEMLGFVYYDPIALKGATLPIGKLSYFSFEAEAKYKIEKFTVGINHSYVKQISWKSANGVTTQGISYADYNYNGLQSTGNNINNWANNSTKLFTNIKLPYQFTLHTDGQIFWKWNGYEDVQLMYSTKYASGNAAWEALNKKLNDENFAGTDIRLNVSISKFFPKIKTTVSIYGSNLLGTKRYSYSSGEKFNYPSKLMWVNEPFAIGFKISVDGLSF